MDIRTRLALALVSVALLSMLLLGTFAYQVASDMFQDITERQLDALAETKQQDLEQVIASWQNQVRLIRSRTQLRIQLNDLQASNNETSLPEIKRILEDAQESTANVQRITIFDRSGKEVASAGSATRGAVASGSSDLLGITYSGFYIGTDDQPKVVFSSAMELNDDQIGSIEIIFNVVNVEELASNYRGLGKSGETLIVGYDQTGALVLLHALRHSDDQPKWQPPPDFIQTAIAGTARTYTENAVDYRGKSVWAATRYVENVNWGLVVKVDADEETQRARDFREDMIDLALALGAFAVVGGTMLGFYLARPIRDLAHTVDRIKHGETSLRLDEQSDDEVGLLAAALNDFLDQLDANKVPPDNDGNA